MRTRLAFLALPAALAAFAPALAQAQNFTFDGAVQTTGGDFFYLPFTVPAGTQEIEILHADLSSNNILDWGLDDANGTFRGWGGGNTENAVVGIDRASRSYLTGPITAGTWRVVVGKAKLIDLPGAYHVEVTLRAAPTLPAQPERTPYVAAAPLSTGPRWYAGDLHVHSRESGDASPTLDAIATLASNRGLDFVILSDHNTVSQFDYVVDAQSRHPSLLLIPGDEFTTYAGHANAIGVHAWVSHRIGDAGWTIGNAVDAIHAQGALFSINHPALNLGNACIGCAWKHDVPAEKVDGVEIANGGWSEVGNLFDPQAIQFWEMVLDSGSHAVALGGSDDHSAGVNEGTYGSPIGDPTTLVYADDLSEASILAGIRAGRTVVKLQGPGDPMVELSADVPFTSSISSAAAATFTAHVTGGSGQTVRFVVNGKSGKSVDVTSDPFDATLHVAGPARVRAEVLVAGAARTITSHLFLEGHPSSAKGCGCALSAPGDAGRLAFSGSIGAVLLALAAARARRRAARPS